MKNQTQKKQKSRYNLAVRILALALSLLVTGGALTYLVTLIMNLF